MDKTFTFLLAITALNILMFAAASTELVRSYANDEALASAGEGEGEGEGENSDLLETPGNSYYNTARATSPGLNKVLCDY